MKPSLDQLDRSSVADVLRAAPMVPVITIENIEDVKTPSSSFQMTIKNPDSKDIKKITLKSRIDTNAEVNYYVNGGILQFVLRKLLND